MNFNFTIKNDKLKAVSSPKGKTGNVNTYTCNFDIACDIPNLIWFCVFKQGDNIYSQHITDGSCVIPYEVLSDVKPLYIGCYGTNADDGIKRVSTNFVYFDVKQGAYSEATAPETPTPDLWESLIGKTVPYIGDNGNWFIYDMKTKSYVDSSYPSCGSGGIDTPGLANKDLSNVEDDKFAAKIEKVKELLSLPITFVDNVSEYDVDKLVGELVDVEGDNITLMSGDMTLEPDVQEVHVPTLYKITSNARYYVDDDGLTQKQENTLLTPYYIFVQGVTEKVDELNTQYLCRQFKATLDGLFTRRQIISSSGGILPGVNITWAEWEEYGNSEAHNTNAITYEIGYENEIDTYCGNAEFTDMETEPILYKIVGKERPSGDIIFADYFTAYYLLVFYSTDGTTVGQTVSQFKWMESGIWERTLRFHMSGKPLEWSSWERFGGGGSIDTSGLAKTDLSNVTGEDFAEKFNEVFPEGVGGTEDFIIETTVTYNSSTKTFTGGETEVTALSIITAHDKGINVKLKVIISNFNKTFMLPLTLITTTTSRVEFGGVFVNPTGSSMTDNIGLTFTLFSGQNAFMITQNAFAKTDLSNISDEDFLAKLNTVLPDGDEVSY